MGDKAIFDKAQLLTMSADDEDIATEVAGLFLDDIPKQLADLKIAYDSGDVSTAERVAHSIKGASATVGSEKLRQIAEINEGLAREGNLGEAVANFPELELRFTEVANAMRNAGYKPLENE